MKNKNLPQTNNDGAVLMFDETEKDLELYPEFILDDTGSNMTVIIKHNYYSSDNDHGRDLLSSFLDVIIDEYKKISRIILIDSGVLLFDDNDKLYRYSQKFIELGIQLILCRESLSFYNVETDRSTGLLILSSHEIALEIMNSPYVTVLS